MEIVPISVGFIVLMALGLPIGTALGIAAVITVFYFDLGMGMLGVNFSSGIASFPLLAIPFFVLAGVILEKAGLAATIAHFFELLVGRAVGGLAMVAGVLPRTLAGSLGIIYPEQIASAIIPRTADHHFAPTTLVAIENTTNRGGGAIYDLETVAAIGRLAKEEGIRVHCDGARLFNAVVATGVAAAEYAAYVDTVSFCLSKGLGAPVGSLLTGDAATIEAAASSGA